MSHDKTVMLVGDHDGEVLALWKKWAEQSGYVCVCKSLEDLKDMVHGENPLIIIDSYGLNDVPLPPLKRGRMVIDHVDMHINRALLCAALAVVAEHERKQDYVIKPKPHMDEPRFTDGRPYRSKGEKRGNRRYRWC